MGIQDWSDAATIAAFVLALLVVVEEALAWSNCEANSILQVLTKAGCCGAAGDEPNPVIVVV